MTDLNRLIDRFKRMAQARRDVAARWERQRPLGHSEHAIQSSGAAADAYDRCARELERVAAGEVPPEPGHEWPELP